MNFDKIQIGKRYRIKIRKGKTFVTLKANVIANDTKKKILKVETKDGPKEYKYSAIRKIQTMDLFRLKIVLWILLAIILGPRLIKTCIKTAVGCSKSEVLYCQGFKCRCESLMLKPIIYLYPEQETKVSVELGYPKNTTHTYPKYKKAWNVQAKPNGDLKDLKTGRHYYALYWEGKKLEHSDKTEEGFVVKGKNTISFLEEKLEQLGLNNREAEEFIIYWLPKLEDSPYNFIRFQTIEEQNKNMPLIIKPEPQTVIRVMIEYRNLDERIKVKEQVLPQKPQRDGFTVVEWGGTEI